MNVEDLIRSTFREYADVAPPPADPSALAAAGRTRRARMAIGRVVAVTLVGGGVLAGGTLLRSPEGLLSPVTGPPSQTPGLEKVCSHLLAAKDALAHGDVGTASDEIVLADSWSQAAVEDASSDDRDAVLRFAAAVADAVPYIGGDRAANDIATAAEICD